MILDRKYQDEAVQLLKQSSMFHTCKEENLRKVAADMDRIEFKKGDILCEQGQPQDRAFFVANGQIRRERMVNDRTHQVVDTFGTSDAVDLYGNRKIAIGVLHVLHKEPSFAEAKCMSNGYLYALPSEVLHRHLKDSNLSTKETFEHAMAEITREMSCGRSMSSIENALDDIDNVTQP